MKKKALITGASSGIGAATATMLAENGFDLVLLARRSDKIDLLAESLVQKYGAEVKKLIGDVRDKENLEYLLNTLPASWKVLDVLVNNAGLSQGLDPVDRGDTVDWDTMIDTNVKGLLYVSRIVSAWMVNAGKGHIVNIGSIAGKEVYPNGNVYCATKHAVDALTQGMRMDLVGHGIKVTAINPGMVETEFSIVRFKGDGNRAKKVYEGLEPLIAADIADAVYYAVSRPTHVNINDMLIMPTAQASATILKRD